MTSLELAKELACNHNKLLRTIRRLSNNGLESEIIEDTFTNKMNREYIMCHLSDRVVNIIEGLYLYSSIKEKEINSIKSDYENGVVYFIYDGNNVKIGHSTNLDTRISALQVGNPNFIEVLATIDNAGKQIESEIHEMFSNDRLSGEWFDLDSSFLLKVKKKYKLINIFLNLESLIFELWHNSDKNTKELTLNDIITTDNYRVKRKLKNIIEKYLNSNLPYLDILDNVKSEISVYADSLNFNRKSLKSQI